MSKLGIIISLTNRKGGVAKTTSTVNIGRYLSMLGFKVLLIDNDPQANLSLCYDIEDKGDDFRDFLTGKKALEEVVVQKYGVSVIPGSLLLADAELEFISFTAREFLLKDAIENNNVQSKFDFILIDCKPDWGILTQNAIVASKYVLIPSSLESMPYKGVHEIISTINKAIKPRLNKSLEFLGVFGTMSQSNISLNNAVYEAFDDTLAPRFETRIRKNVDLAEAPSHGKPIFDYNKDCNGAEDYKKLTEEILKRINVAIPSN